MGPLPTGSSSPANSYRLWQQSVARHMARGLSQAEAWRRATAETGYQPPVRPSKSAESRFLSPGASSTGTPIPDDTLSMPRLNIRDALRIMG